MKHEDNQHVVTDKGIHAGLLRISGTELNHDGPEKQGSLSHRFVVLLLTVD